MDEYIKKVEKLMSATDKVISEAKSEVARKIFADIDELLSPYGTYIKTIDIEEYVELKKKYMEEYHEIS